MTEVLEMGKCCCSYRGPLLVLSTQAKGLTASHPEPTSACLGSHVSLYTRVLCMRKYRAKGCCLLTGRLPKGSLLVMPIATLGEGLLL